MTNDPWNTPTEVPIPSEFASIDSFRGRLVLITVTGYETNVPNQAEPGKFSDRVTATVLTVDGKGRVQQYAQKAPTGAYLEGPEHLGVWFSQTRVLPVLAPDGVQSIGRMTLAVPETYKPGKIAGKGNAWGLVDPTEEQKQTARDFLAGRTVAAATAAPAADDPFAV